MGEWFLAAFAPHIRGCNLSTAHRPTNDTDRFHLWQGQIWVWSHAPLDGITFYPEVYYHGVQVFPQHWHPESNEPRVACHMPLNVRPGETAEQSRARRQTLLDEGWAYSAWEGLARYVHVDELQKIEGPPPEGAF